MMAKIFILPLFGFRMMVIICTLDDVLGPPLTFNRPTKLCDFSFASDAGTNIIPTATLNWSTGGGYPAGYKVAISTNPPPLASFVDVLNATTYDPPGDFSYNQTYYWQVIPYNNNGDASGCDVWSFTTGPDPTITAPFCESFDDPVFPPYGWINEKTGGPDNPGTWDQQSSGTYPSCSPQSGAGMTRYNCYSYHTPTQGILVTPPINLPNDNFMVSFWMYRDGGYADSLDLVNVYYNTIPNTTGATLLGNIHRSMYLPPVVITEGWYLYEMAMPSGSTGNGRYIIFEAISNYGNNIFLDDVCIESYTSIPSCATNNSPPDLSTDISISSLLYWSPGGGAHSGYRISLGTDDPPTNMLDDYDLGNVNSFDPGLLNYETNYYWQIIPYNGFGDATGCPIWSFSTMPDPSISSFPYCESFESGLGTWMQTSGDDFDWTVNTGGTTSTGTGPSSAYDCSYYVYTESSDPNYPNKYAGLYNIFNFAVGGLTNPVIEFAYHMYGATMGTLALQVSTDYGANWTNEWSLSGDQGDSWYTTSVDLSTYGNTDNVLLRWWGYTGSSYYSDMAVDDICIGEITTVPNCTNIISPADLANDIQISSTLNWSSGGGGPTGYTINFGTDNPPTNILYDHDLGNVSSYDPGLLNYETTYYWQIIPYNGFGDATGCDIWSFTVESADADLDPTPWWQTVTASHLANDNVVYSVYLKDGFSYNFSICELDGVGGMYTGQGGGDGDLTLYSDVSLTNQVWYWDGLSGCSWNSSTLGSPYEDYSPANTQNYYLKVDNYSSSYGGDFVLAYQGDFIPLNLTTDCLTTNVPPFEENSGVYYRLELSTQEMYNFSTCVTDICAGDALSNDTDFELFDETGTSLWYLDGFQSCGYHASTYGYSRENYSPPADGIYFLYINDYFNAAGSDITLAYIKALCAPIITFPFVENFDAGIVPPSCWSQIINDPTYTWEAGPGYAQCIHWQTQDEWLITPEFDFSLLISPILSFDWQTDDDWMVPPNDNGDIFCKISTDNGTTWTTLWSENEEAPFDPIFYTKNLDLSSYAGESNVMFAFHYSVPVEYASAIYIDNVMVLEGASSDPVTTIESPVFCYGDQVEIPVTVENFNNIGGISLTIDFDPAMLTYNDVVLDPLIAVSYTDIPTPGQFRLPGQMEQE